MESQAGHIPSGAGGPGAFSVLARSTLPEEIAARVLGLIRAQQLRPGDKLPAERSLAAMLEVSRPVLREALRALAIMNVVDIRQGSGTYITALEPHKLVSHLDFAFSKDSVALVEVFEARRVVEVGNVRLAAQRVTDEHLRQLETILADLEAAVGDAASFSDLDIRFHNVICDAAQNFLLTQFMSIINTLAKVSRERTGSHREVREATIQDHRRIVEALAERDPDAAAQAMRAHLDHVERVLEAAPAAGSAPEPAPEPAPEAAPQPAPEPAR